LGQYSWYKLSYISGVWKAIWVKILGANYYTLLEYGKVFAMPKKKKKNTTKQNPQKQTNFVETEQNVLFSAIYMTTVPL
jgi:hypothetical protein